MKKIILIALLFCACKKQEENKTWVEVKDSVTGGAVKGASVLIYKCTPGDPFCGFIAWQSAVTGDDGRCSFKTADYDIVTFNEVFKAGYWNPPTGTKNTRVSLCPEGWMRLRIIRGTSYPASSNLSIHAYGLDPTTVSFSNVNTAADSTILVRCFGGQYNRIEWRVTGPTNISLNNGTWNQVVPRLDTVGVTLNY